MPYQIGIYIHNCLLFSTNPDSCKNIQQTIPVFQALDKRFLEEQGYSLTIFRLPGSHLQVDGMDFKKTVDIWPPTKIQELFFDIQDFRLFCEPKQVLTVQQAIHEYQLSAVRYHLDVTAVHLYQPGYYLIETHHQKKYTLPSAVPLHGVDLEEMEKELFMDWLLGQEPND